MEKPITTLIVGILFVFVCASAILLGLHGENADGELMWPVVSDDRPPAAMAYYNPVVLPFPQEHVGKLHAAGLAYEEIAGIADVYANYKGAYAYVRLPNEIPTEDALALARYASIIIGDGIDPNLIVAVMRTEHSARGNGIGDCRYFPENGAMPVISPMDRRIGDREAKAFMEIVDAINATRDPRYRMKYSYPVVSCHGTGTRGGAMGVFQILPTAYLQHEKEVRAATEETGFANPYKIIPQFLAATAILRDIARSHNAAPESVSVANPDLFRGVAAKYYAGKRWKHHIGDNRYGGIVLAAAVRIGGM
ncbi:MAG: hypothetical protein HYS43_01250 [Candidatus Liptonbacteria bacterium]|nr:hypothetical protein [Candidatus Liptonbacteria bacterium]